MKKQIKHLVIALVPIFIACGGAENTTENEVGTEAQTETEIKKEFEDIDDLMTKNTFTTAEFSRLTTFLYQKEATLVGYPYAYPGDSEVEFVPNTTQMIDGVDNNSMSVKISVTFKNGAENKQLKKGELFALKGKLDVGYNVTEKWGNETYIKLYDAEYAENTPTESFGAVTEMDLSKPVLLSELYLVMNAHYEKINAKESIEIVDEYNNTSTSTTSYGVTYDVVLGNEAPVHCYVTDGPDNDALNAKRNAGEHVKIKGKFGGSGYTPSLINGVIL